MSPYPGKSLYVQLDRPIPGVSPGAYRVRHKDSWGPDSTLLLSREAVIAAPESYRWEPWRPSLYDMIGLKVFVRTVTYARVGIVVWADDQHIYLHPCADVIETGAFTAFFTGQPKAFAVVPTTLERPATAQIGACVTIDPYDGKIPISGGE